MGENFFININCSKILIGNCETQYTMFIDRSKISIVYELVEWIRWIFSVEYCIYLSHENSVIHELEDIQLLSKLKNFEIIPCGRSHCIHKTTYRILLSNLNLFVSWNEMKVHKYFVDKLNQIDQKLNHESNRENTTMLISSNIEAHENLINCKNSNIRTISDNIFFSDSQFSNSNVKNSSLIEKAAAVDSLESESVANEKLKMKSCFSKSPAKSPIKKKFNVEEVARNDYTKPKSKKTSSKYFKPFSVGEILSSLRKDFEKHNTEVTNEKVASPVKYSVSEEGDFNDKITTEDSVLMNGDKMTGFKKRQRTRKRKRSKKHNSESETFMSSFLQNNDTVSNVNYLKSNNAVKPNHIRFDVDEEDNLVDNNCVGNGAEEKDKNDFELIDDKINGLNSLTFFNAEPEKSVTVLKDNDQNLSDSQLLNSSFISTESKMECCSAVDDLIQIEEKESTLDVHLDDPVSDSINQTCSAAENFQSVSYNPDLNILASLKENCRNSVVIKRFY